MQVDKYISDLLYEHDCVIIPGFGGFIGNYSPSRIDPVHHTFSPPCKTLLFNINLKQNDGLLASRIAHNEKIPYEEAIQHIRHYTGLIISALKESKQFTLSNIGTLISSREGNIQFNQSADTNFLGDAFGLSPLVSLPVQRPGFQDRMEKKISRYIDSPQGQKRTLPKALKWAAILALPVGLATFLSIANFDRIKDLSVTYSGILYSIGPTVSNSRSNTTQNKSTVNLAEASTKVESRVPAASVAGPVAEPSPSPEPVRSAAPDSRGSLSIIVGAFRIQGNAERLVADLRAKGHDACIVDQTKNGLYRVSIEDFTDKAGALDELARVRAEGFPSAWLLEK
jgi:cell division septation protein DedD